MAGFCLEIFDAFTLPLVLDREFIFLELLLNLVEECIHFVIRLNLRSNLPKFFVKVAKK